MGLYRKISKLFQAKSRSASPDSMLLPFVWQTGFLACNDAFIEGVVGSNSVPRERHLLARHLAVVLECDHETDDETQFEGRDWAELFELARANLAQRSHTSWKRLSKNAWRSPWSDGRDSARLCVPSCIRELEVRGRHVAMVPSVNCVLVFGTEDPAVEQLLATGLAEFEQAGRRDRTSALPVVLSDDGRWETWSDVPEQAREMRYMIEVNELHEYLNERAEVGGTGDPAQVPGGVSFDYRSDDDVLTTARWTPETTELLDAQRFVIGRETAFCRRLASAAASVAGDSGSVRALQYSKPIERAEFMRDFGHLLRPACDWPERFVVERFPSESELALARVDLA